ncbi:MAG: hypothetical protein J0H09_22900 [Burkholderiales bacterium]|nr:hypothetical protein [Burkholderiales bacterium]
MNVAAAATPTRIHVERRFPLDLSQSIASIRELYEAAKRSRWDPMKDIDWPALSADRHDAALRDAARRVWSRRAWVEYTGLAETPALLIRFCLEIDREADPKYFLTVRNTEEAWHVEAFHLAAENFGGYLDRPADPAWEPVINQTLYRDALDADRSLDGYVAAHCAVEDGLELELFEAYAAATRDRVLKQLFEHVLADKRRHASFGWLYLESRVAQADRAQRESIARAVAAWIENVAFTGYHVPTLSATIDTRADAQAAALLEQAGLGAIDAAREEQVFVDYLGRARQRLAELGIVPVVAPHPRLGRL